MPDSRLTYWTLNGNPPNGGFPPNTIFAGPPFPMPYGVTHQAPPTPPLHPSHVVDHGVAHQQHRVPTPPPPYTGPPPFIAAPQPQYYAAVQFLPYHMTQAYPTPPPTPPSPPSPLPQGITLDGATVDFGNGVSYIFPEKHTLIHFIKRNHHPWNHPAKRFDYSVHKVPTMMTLKELIRQLGAPKGKDDRVGITETIELGDGAWLKGSTFVLSHDRSKQTLEDLGWDEQRGKNKKPVWVAMWIT